MIYTLVKGLKHKLCYDTTTKQYVHYYLGVEIWRKEGKRYTKEEICNTDIYQRYYELANRIANAEVY